MAGVAVVAGPDGVAGHNKAASAGGMKLGDECGLIVL